MSHIQVWASRPGRYGRANRLICDVDVFDHPSTQVTVYP